MRNVVWSTIGAAGLALGTATHAAAQSASGDVLARGIDPVGNKLSPSFDSLLTLAGARLPAPQSYQLDAWLDYNHGLLAFQLGDEKIGDLIRHRLDLHLHGAVVVAEGLELALDVPVTLWQAHGWDRLRAETGFADAEPSAAGLGDVRLLARYAFLRDPDGPLLAAAIVEGRGLTGSGDDFLGERKLMLHPRLAIERSLLGRLRLTAEVGYRYRPEPGQYLNLYVGDEWTLGLGAELALPGQTPMQNRIYAELLAATPTRAPFTFSAADALKTPLEALVGYRRELSDRFQASVGVGRGLAITPGYGRSAFRAFASVRFEVEHDPAQAVADQDSDGLMDVEDRCPNEPGPPELDGCFDSDSDSIPDIEDRCPDEKGAPKFDGCPPDRPLVEYEEGEMTVFGTINFDSGKATLKQESFEVVDTVAKLLHGHPEIRRLRIEGHTDGVGSAASNLDLSERRAATVREYLVNEGIAAERLESRGYGEEQPIDTNDTALGRAKNRRVVFTVLEVAP